MTTFVTGYILRFAVRLSAACILTRATMQAIGAQPLPPAPRLTPEDAARHSPLVARAYSALQRDARRITDRRLRTETLDAITNPSTCVRHRRNLHTADRQRIFEQLRTNGLLVGSDSTQMFRGVFPPLRNDEGECPRLREAFNYAPGGAHHDYPGGLAVHEAYNLGVALDLAHRNEDLYAKDPPGLVAPIN